MRFVRSLTDGWREFWALSWWAKGPVFVTTAVLLIALISVAAATGGESTSEDELAEQVAQIIAKTPEAEPTVFVTRVPPPSPVVRTTVVVITPTPAPEPSPTAIPTPIGPRTTFGDGIHAVGDDIAAGTYKNSGREGCYWARLSGFSGDLDEIITNGLGDEQIIVQISPNDVGFESTRCGTWQLQ